MGAGSYGAGIGPAGFDPVVSTDPRDVTYPAAVEYDPVDKYFPQDSDGFLTELHPVDQKMATGLLFRKGSLQSSPEVGNTFSEIENLYADNLAEDIRDRIEKSVPIDELLANGDVYIFDIDHDLVEHGGLKVAVHYYNLRADPRKKDPKTLDFG